MLPIAIEPPNGSVPIDGVVVTELGNAVDVAGMVVVPGVVGVTTPVCAGVGAGGVVNGCDI